MDPDAELMLMRDERNAAFERSLAFTSLDILGVRVPDLRRLAKTISKGDWHSFLEKRPCRYAEEVMLRGMVIGYAKMPLEERLGYYSDFVPLIDGWGTCDTVCSTWKVPRNDAEDVWAFLLPFMHSGKEYSMRFAAVMMLCNFIDAEHIDRVISEMDAARCDGQYLKKAVAWVLSVCYVRFPARTMDYLRGINALDDFTYNLTIQKIIESYRVDDADKDVLRKMKRKFTSVP